MIDEEKYRQMKADNLRAYSEKKKVKETRTEKKDKYRLYQMVSYLIETGKMKIADIAYVFGLSETTVAGMLSEWKDEFEMEHNGDEEIVEQIKADSAIKRQNFLIGLNKI